MKNSIEAIWKEGFLKETSLVAPKINDLYNQKSRHLVDKMIRMFRINLLIIVLIAILFPIIYSFLEFVWQGVVASLLLFLTAWYNWQQMHGIKTLDHGATSLDYLKSFHRWLRDVLSRSEKIARFSYPVYFLIAVSTIWSAWSKQEKLFFQIHQHFADMVIVGNVTLFAMIVVVASTLLMIYVSRRIAKWEIRLMYGRVIDKLEKTISEMETLKGEN